MAPKRRQTSNINVDSKKKLSKHEIERKICRRKLDSLEEEESRIKEDRFTSDEKSKLIDAYNDHGFHIFQNPSMLLEYLPNRRESDIKGLLQRLQNTLQSNETNTEAIYNQEWQKLCIKMMANFAKDKKINMDQVFADAMRLEADELSKNEGGTQEDAPDYPELLKSFSQLIMGIFPDMMSPTNAQVSMHLFQHINEVAESICSETTFASLSDGRWLEETVQSRRKRQEMALKGLKCFDGTTKKCPTFRDIETNPNIEALCLELPKIRRVTDVLNPLQIDDLNNKYSDIILNPLGARE